MNLCHRVLWVCLTAGVISCLNPETAWGEAGRVVTVVGPNALANSEGNSFGNDPFDGLLTSSRYQQVFDASEFALLQNGGGFVNFMALRLNGICLGEGQIIPNFQINFSTTSRRPDSLSSVFAENVGHDDTIVRGPGRFTILGSCNPGSMPQSFNMFIRFDTPFFYDPNVGNLLMDLRNYSGSPSDGSLLLLDGHDAMGDAISSLFAFNVDLPMGRPSSFGYVTEFVVQAVPEPSTWALLALGVFVGTASWVCQRRKRAGAGQG